MLVQFCKSPTNFFSIIINFYFLKKNDYFFEFLTKKLTFVLNNVAT